MSFRTRLTLTFAAVFLAAGVGLLISTYLVVNQLFNQNMVSDGALFDGTTPADLSGVTTPAEEFFLLSAEQQDALTWGPATGVPGVTARIPSELVNLTETDTLHGLTLAVASTEVALRGEVLSALGIWSAVILVIFAALAALAAWLLSRTALRRIGRITEATREITQSGLDRRLDLPGPTDEIKELGDTIDEMLGRLEASFERQRRFIANTSHELRTPIATVRSALEIPLAQGRVPEELEAAFARAVRATERSENIIAGLLDMARSDAACPENMEVLDLSTTVAESLADAAERLDSAGLLPESSLNGVAAVRAEPALLRQVVDNLIGNAIGHGRAGGTLRIITAEDPAAGTVTLQVANTAAGSLEGMDWDALVEPFNRGENTRLAASDTAPGEGLGLSLVASIIARYGGTLELAPNAAGEFTALITLPAAAVPAVSAG